MKTRWWWLLVLLPGLAASFVMFANADVIGPGSEEQPPEAPRVEPDCSYHEDDNGTMHEECTQPVQDGATQGGPGDPFWNYLNRIPVPDHPGVAWTGFAVVMVGILTKGTIIPLIDAIDRARDNNRSRHNERD